MFKFLKNKLKETVDKFTKKAEEESEELEEETLSDENISLLDAEKLAVETTKNTIYKNEFKSVDSLIPEVKEELSKSDKKEKFEDDLIENISEPKVIAKPIIKKVKEEKQIKSKKADIQKEKEKPVTIIEDVDESVEVDPLIEEIIEKNKSFEESEQQTITPEINATIEEKKPEIINEDISKEEIVEDNVKDSDVVEDIIAVDTEDILDNSEKTEEKKGFFKRIFSKKEDELEQVLEKEVVDSKKISKIDDLAEDIVEDLEQVTKDVKEQTKKFKDDLIKDESDFTKEAVHKELLSDDIGDATKKKKGFFGKIKERVVKFQLTDEIFEELFWDFELALLEGNVAGEVIEKIKSDLKEQLTSENISRKEISNVIFETLKNSLDEILSVPTFDLIEKVKSKKPFVICIVGVNGSGKTTTLAKLINLFQKKDLSLVVAAADTFRAAAIQQLEEHTTKLGVKLIKHDYNADPAAVAFDAIKHAQAKNLDVVLIDTAGRLQSNSNLMDELKKLIRVNKPDLTLFIGESITGNDCVEQAVAFNEAVNVDGIILSKVDVDDKGGAAISVSYVTKKPILYLGTGQTYDDLKPFNKEDMLQTLGL